MKKHTEAEKVVIVGEALKIVDQAFNEVLPTIGPVSLSISFNEFEYPNDLDPYCPYADAKKAYENGYFNLIVGLDWGKDEKDQAFAIANNTVWILRYRQGGGWHRRAGSSLNKVLLPDFEGKKNHLPEFGSKARNLL